MNVDDDFRFTQFFAEVLILATQLLVFFVQGAALGLGATLLWCQGMQDSRGTLVPPRHQVRGVQALTPEQGTDATRLLFGLIGFGQDSTPGGSASLRSASLRSAARAEEYVFVFFMLNFLPALLRN